MTSNIGEVVSQYDSLEKEVARLAALLGAARVPFPDRPTLTSFLGAVAVDTRFDPACVMLALRDYRNTLATLATHKGIKS